MSEILIDQDAILVDEHNTVIVDSSIGSQTIETAPVVQVHPEHFVLSSGGMFAGNGLIGAVPDWLLNAVQQELTTGAGNITSVVLGMQSLLDGLQTGVSQAISSLNTLSSSQSGITTSLQSQVDANKAEALNLIATKTTVLEAQAVAASAIQSVFGIDAAAYVGGIASTYVDANSAIAQDIQMLTASVNGVSGSISDISLLTIETVQNPLWVDDGFLADPDALGHPRYITRAKATKQLQVDANGVISGILLESGATSAVTIQGDQFKLVATGQSVASRNPFTVDAATGQITFNGQVSFNSVTDAPAMVAANTNINVTTNLVPNAGWGVGGYGDYQFVGTPLYYRMLGAGTVAEDTLLLNVGDEVYTPYIEDMTLSYKLSYSFKGAKIGSFITVIGATPTSVDIIPVGVTVDPLKWYNVQLAVLPNGTTGGNLYGFIQESATMNIVSVIADVVLGVGIEKFLMGFVATADTYISRVGIEVITSNTLSSVPVTASNLSNALASTSTVIDGARIATGSITAGSIDSYAISGKIITGGEINGSTINGANIIGSVIKSSWVDYTTTGDLTNWQFYTQATIPALYSANFAHNNTTGELIVDSSGYVRLPGKSNFNTGIYNQSSTTSLSAYTVPIYSYNNYITTSTNRAINNIANIVFLSDYTIPLVQVIQDGSAGSNGTAVMTGSISIFGTSIEWSFISEFPSAYTVYYTVWIKVNGAFIYNPGRLRVDGNYPYYATTQHTSYGFNYTISFNTIPSTNLIGLVIKFVSQINTVTGQGNGTLGLVSSSKTGSNFPTTLSVNFPLMQIT